MSFKVSSEVNSFRDKIIRGQVSDIIKDLKKWKRLSFKLIVFLSSTFTDTQRERNFLINELHPILSQLGRLYNIEVIFVDMRWGLVDENTIDHLTWISCSAELERCREESSGLFFLSLQCEKFGYCPLPKYLSKEHFESRISEASDSDRELACEWYHLDTNAVPDGRYVLKNLSSVNDNSYWKVALPRLLKVFDGVEFSPGLIVGHSVTEYEMRAAYGEGADVHRMGWLCREFSGGVTDKGKFRDFDDTQGEEIDAQRKREMFGDMVQFMRSKFLPESVQRFASASYKDFLEESSAWKSQFEDWKACASAVLKTSLEEVIDLKKSWIEDGCGLGLPGDELDEVLHHWEWAAAKVRSFHGREEEVKRALEVIRSSERGDPKVYPYLGGVSAAIIAESGAGKTALMSKLATCLAGEDGDGASKPVVVRFCGTSPGSSNAQSVVRSVCIQLCYIYPEARSDKSLLEVIKDILGQPYDELVSFFHKLLHEYPVYLFIDSLDQLTNENMGRSEVSFLRKVDPHADGRIIVSCLPDDSKYLYGCSSKLVQSKVQVVSLALTEGDTKTIVTQLLEDQNRRLTPLQLQLVCDVVKEEPTALCVTLAVSVVSTWLSSDDENASQLRLERGVANLLHQIFDTIERSFDTIESCVSLHRVFCERCNGH